MKAFNLKAETITIANRPLTLIMLGEEGRGRMQHKIECPSGLQDGDAVTPIFGEVKASGIHTKSRIISGDDGKPGWIARISTHGAYIRGADANVSYDPSQAPEPPQLLSKAYGAFGAAGRTGTWADVLITVAPGTLLRVKPTRQPAYFLWFQDNSVDELSNDERELLGLDFDLENKIRI